MTRLDWSMVAAAAVCLGVWPAAGAAQSQVHLAFPAPVTCVDRCAGQLLTFDPDTARIEVATTIPAGLGLNLAGFYGTPDGGLLVWAGAVTSGFPYQLTALDVSSRQAVPLGPTVSPEFLGHPSRPEIYTADVRGPLIVSAAGTRRMTDFSCSSWYPPRTGKVSADGTRVSFWCASQEAVFDTSTGDLIRALPQNGATALGRDGHSFYQAEYAQPLRRIDVQTGATVAQVAVVSPPRFLEVDPRTGEVYLIDTGVDIFDGETLALTRSTTVPGLRGMVMEWTFDRFRPRAYVVTRESSGPRLIDRYYVVDTSTMTILLAADVLPEMTNPAQFAVTYRPSAPRGAAAVVAGGRVDLAWQAGPTEGAVVRYVLEVGSAPGLSDIFTGLDVGLQTSFTASGVPPGRYYVRVRAGNYTGLSAPSNEVVVQVP